MKPYRNFADAIHFVREKLISDSYVVRTEKWQGIPLEHDMRETLKTSFHVAMNWPIETLIKDIKPNLDWADEHFKERVSGIPSNPGESYKRWPFYGRDKEMRNHNEKFTHTYMERFWPKFAKGEPSWYEGDDEEQVSRLPNIGTRFEYGDLKDVINLLYKEPYTRQAYLPIFFPEDTGAVHGGRIPCTLGYHFMRRGDSLHVDYYIRSCDYLRHFRDDIYLCVRLVQYLIEKLHEKGDYNHVMPNLWSNVTPGIFSMHITSLHIFANEYELIKKFNK